MTLLLMMVFSTLLNRQAFAARLVAERTGELHANQAQMSKYVEQLELSQAALKKRTREMTELAQDYKTQKELAETSEKSKSEFLASMSHEIRTPMTGVLGMADILLETNLDPLQRENVLKIKSAGRSLLTILNDILDLSKMDAGRLEIEAIDFNLGTVITDAVDLVRDKAEEKGLLLSVEMPKTVPVSVRGDPTRIRQVLINLVGNAVKFTHTGSVALRVRHEARDDGYLLRFEVADSGIGIPAEIQASLFEDFTQADTSTSRRYEGTGLGLAISKRLTQLMGGEIGVDSEEGEGSVFWFTVNVEAGRETVSKSDKPTEAAAFQARRSLRILIAEDNGLNQMILKSLLEPLGHELTVVASGMGAVEAVKGASFDLILMDIRMPELDGPDATQAIRRMDGERGRIPIIAVTADVMDENVRHYAQVGMNATVFKPINRAELITAMDEVLGEDVHLRTSAPPATEAPAPASPQGADEEAEQTPQEVVAFLANLDGVVGGKGS